MQFNIITENKSEFLNTHFKDAWFDQSIFRAAAHFIEDYRGGRWELVATESDAAFMMLKDHPLSVLTHPTTGEDLVVNSYLTGMILTHCVLLGRIQEGMEGLTNQHRKLKAALADYCIELNRGDVLEALLV